MVPFDRAMTIIVFIWHAVNINHVYLQRGLAAFLIAKLLPAVANFGQAASVSVMVVSLYNIDSL